MFGILQNEVFYASGGPDKGKKTNRKGQHIIPGIEECMDRDEEGERNSLVGDLVGYRMIYDRATQLS